MENEKTRFRSIYTIAVWWTWFVPTLLLVILFSLKNHSVQQTYSFHVLEFPMVRLTPQLRPAGFPVSFTYSKTRTAKNQKSCIVSIDCGVLFHIIVT